MAELIVRINFADAGSGQPTEGTGVGLKELLEAINTNQVNIAAEITAIKAAADFATAKGLPAAVLDTITFE